MKPIKKEMRGLNFRNFIAEGYTRPDVFNDLKDAYEKHSWLYAGIKAIATNISGLPLSAYRRDRDGNWVEYPKNKLAAMLQNPNSYYSLSYLLAGTSVFLDLTGNAYWGKEKEVDEIYLLPSHEVRAVGSKDTLIVHYEHKVGAKWVPYELDEIIHFREFNPKDQIYGIGPVSAAKMSLIVDWFAQDYNKAFFKNNARPDCVLETDQVLDDDHAKRLSESWKEKHSGPDNRGKTALLDAGLKYKEINRAPKDVDYIEGRKANREEILAALGVPPAVVGVYEYANYANSKEQTQIFWKHTLLPRIKLISGTLTMWSQRYLKDKESVIELDTDQVEALRVDEGQRATTAKTYVDMGIPLNQVIGSLDLPFDPVEGGDVSRPAPAPGFGQPPAAAPAKGIKSLAGPERMAEAKKEMLWKQYDRLLSGHESAMKIAMRGFFKGQRRRILKEWAEHGPKILTPHLGKAITKQAALDLDMIFDPEKEQGRMRPPAYRNIRGTYMDFAVRVADKIKPGFDFDLNNPLAQAWIEAKVSKLVTEATVYTMEQITDAIADGVQEAVAEGFSLGESVAEIADRIDEVYQFAQEGRSETIARTEAHAASNAGSLEAMKQAGVQKKEWLHSREGNAREWHRDMDGEQVGVDELFIMSTGAKLDHPGDPKAPPEETVNCRCDCIAVTEDDQ